MKKPHTGNNWFKQDEKVLLEQAARLRESSMKEAAAKREQEELDGLRAAHWLKCPKCGHDMETVIPEGIDVETCTYCKGVCFDRLETESLLFSKTSRRFSFYRRFFGLDWDPGPGGVSAQAV